ncbi:MAG: ABC transporter ATP-binding protein [Chthonomonadales bacterium]
MASLTLTRTSAPVFDLSNVEFHYANGVGALSGIDLTIEAGESVAIMGANGCGKSTLLKLLDGLVQVEIGSAKAFGEELSPANFNNDLFARNYRRQVGFVFQNADAQLFCSTVRDDIAFGPLRMGLTAAEVDQRVADSAAMLGITHLLDRTPYELSGGEKRRAAIASTLSINPSVILLDEPTTGLDPRTRSQLAEILRTLHSAGKTLVIATHDLEFAPQVADRAVILGEDHRIAASLPISEALQDIDLLHRVNLVHTHGHFHGNQYHVHPHSHDGQHEHAHELDSRVNHPQ